MFPILSHSLIASSMEPGLLGDGGSAMPVRALVPALERPPAAEAGPAPTEAPALAPPTRVPPPATATVAIAHSFWHRQYAEADKIFAINYLGDIKLLGGRF